jgi:MFS family permease
MSTRSTPPTNDARLAFVVCLACALSLSSFGSFPALMPRLFVAWQLSTAQAAWVNAAFFAGYMLLSPILTSFTDRSDARRLVLLSCLLGVVSAGGFALFGQHFWAALVTRALAGAATAGSFMPGLRALTDRVHVSRQARYVGYYMGCFALGTSLSYVAAEGLAHTFGLATALAGMALGPLLACGLFALWLRPLGAPPRGRGSLIPNPLPVLRDQRALAFVCAYGIHCWELFTLRSWGVAFLSFEQAHERFRPSGWLAPATVVALANVLTAPASVLGNAAAQRLGTRRWITLVMSCSPLCMAALGASQALPAPLVCALVLACGAMLGADSATITSGLVTSAPLAQRGLSMAVHTTVGFAGAFVGPLLFGLTLDAAGGPSSRSAWLISFFATGTCTLLGGIVVHRRLMRPAL